MTIKCDNGNHIFDLYFSFFLGLRTEPQTHHLDIPSNSVPSGYGLLESR
jgi:hypothetical protein